MAWQQMDSKPLHEAIVIEIVTTFRPKQNGRQFPDNMKCIYLNENIQISILI